MSAVLKNPVVASSDGLGNPAPFLALLPAIRRKAQIGLRHLPPFEREDLVLEVIASAYCAFVQLQRKGKQELAFATPLARYALRHVRMGRRVGNRLNSLDALSPATLIQRGTHVNSLGSALGHGQWEEVVVEDRRAGPAETAAARLDLAEWFRRLPAPLRRIAQTLGSGETTKEAAERFGVTAGRISQLRRILQQSWEEFQGETIGRAI